MRRYHHMWRYKQGRGAALVFVVFVVFLVAAISTSLLSDQFRQIRQLENSRASSQIIQYAYSVEAWAIQVLKNDLAASKTDHLGEAWIRPLPSTEIDLRGNKVAGQISDITSLFDINRLTVEGKSDQRSIQQLKLLLRQYNIDTDVANLLADWIDKDLQAQSSGAESTYYTTLEPAYRTPDQPIQTLDESIFIKGIGAETIQKLHSVATALPAVTEYNLNTMPDELMAALMPGIDMSVVQSLILQRNSAPWESVDEFMKQLIDNSGMDEKEITERVKSQEFSVSSKYFRVTSTVEYDGSVFTMQSDIYRDPTTGMQVYQRNTRFLQ